MKKLYTIILACSIAMPLGVFASSNYTLFVNNNKIDSEIINKNGATYVPVRKIADALGLKVDVIGSEIHLIENKELENNIQNEQISITAEQERMLDTLVDAYFEKYDIIFGDNYIGEMDSVDRLQMCGYLSTIESNTDIGIKNDKFNDLNILAKKTINLILQSKSSWEQRDVNEVKDEAVLFKSKYGH